MGNETVVARVSAMLSRHNSPRDIEHDRLWADACARIRAVVDDPQYQPILLDGEGLNPEGGGMTQAAAKPVRVLGRDYQVDIDGWRGLADRLDAAAEAIAEAAALPGYVLTPATLAAGPAEQAKHLRQVAAMAERRLTQQEAGHQHHV